MNNKPNNLRDMVRRALIGQSELGFGSMVVDSARLSGSEDTALLLAQVDRVVSVRTAMTGIVDNSKAVPNTASVNMEPEYRSLADHCAAINQCQLCSLGETRNKLVYGAGNPEADILFVGEAPGADEDRLGEPFIGRAGKLLDQILVAMKLSREQVYIANILKCRPPGNRDPQSDEMEKCFPHLHEQIRLIKPKLMCALGRIAAQALLKTTTPLGRLRGTWHSYEGVPMLVTYHPAALLRFQKYKKDTWEDMQLLMARYEEMK